MARGPGVFVKITVVPTPRGWVSYLSRTTDRTRRDSAARGDLVASLRRGAASCRRIHIAVGLEHAAQIRHAVADRGPRGDARSSRVPTAADVVLRAVAF